MKHLIPKASILLMAVAFFLYTLLPPVFADAIEGEVIITLGEDLSAEQRATVLSDLGVEDEDAYEIIYVTNQEEHNYLGEYIPASQIGSNAISSAKITLRNDNTGIAVTTNNINYITGAMYTNALATAGVSGAEIYVTAPFAVSGTGALTGIIKAYEETTGETINEELKQAANEEMVVTAELAEDAGIDEDTAVDFMNQIKERIEQENPQTAEELRDLISRLANELGINLTDSQLSQLVDLFNKLRNLNIDWGKVTDTIEATRNWLGDFAESEEGQGVIRSVVNFFEAIWDWFLSIFSNN
ncbi:Uncharacterized protein YpuA, DUF1002 family [Amphibacillus marinus]|uniref:Uncharacterized protein YpuA, DUF1002 family n=1 Tax=Amphibacillus marinus TaxID=872970 RepID=A0A1H8M9Q9_9BACI|nr:DUF1002 domain-containing protein [Amphibacillus marinus]SEO14000.1 Uncharacterized protein YpuA, DUF1002 family [Amphibacillus marinus]